LSGLTAGVVMIDQTRLPHEQVFVTCTTYLEMADAIRSMVIRGAPAIGVAAAMGVALGVQEGADFETVCSTLAATRPTAVNLVWAIERMRRARALNKDLVAEAKLIREEDIAICRAIGPAWRRAGAGSKNRIDALQCGRARDGGLRDRAGRDPRGVGQREKDRRVRG
jgi:methylthioribose-1-phosphate isomerase